MRGTPIIIEPKHIRGNPQTNIVNNNWIDCVTIEEKSAQLSPQSIYTLSVSFYEEVVSAQLSNFKDITSKNSVLPTSIFSLNYTGSTARTETYCYYKINIRNENRTLPSLPSLGLKASVTSLKGSGANTHIATFDSYLRVNQTGGQLAGARAIFKTYTTVQQFENEFLGGNEKLNATYLAAGFIYNENSIDILLVLHKATAYSSDSFYGKYRYNIEFFLNILSTTQKSIRYYLNPTTGACEIAPDTFKAKYPYKHPTNELMQSDSTALNKYNNRREKLSKVIANSILYQWKRGKQTAKVEVLIGLDYFDQNGNRVIGKDLERKMFKPCDWVIPYSVEQDGGTLKKVPLAKNRLGLPKVFEITSAEFGYDGEMKQYLKMVEVIE